MNSPATDTVSALARLDAWLASMGGPVPGGPVVGLRGHSMAFAGPGFDWRIEALSDAWGVLHSRTGDARFLDRIEAALRALATEGIQKGHMARHARTVATAAGVPVDAVEEIARALVAAGDVKVENARRLWEERRRKS